MVDSRSKYRLFIPQALCALAAILIGASASAHTGSSGFHLTKRVLIGGSGFWDYFAVEPDTGRVFIPRGTRVVVLDSDGSKVTEIAGFKRAHAIAFAPDLKLAYLSDGEQVTFLDTDSLKIVKRVSFPKDAPDAILYDSASRRVFAFGEKDATALDANTGGKLAIIRLSGEPEFAQADGSGHVYVNLEDTDEIAELDSKALQVLKIWPIAPCREPHGLAIDVEHKRLFASCAGNNMMMAIQYTDGRVVGSVPIGKGTDASQYDPGTKLAFASSGDGTVTVAHEDSAGKFSVVETIQTEPGARTMALDTKSHNVYTVTAKMGPPAPATLESLKPRPTVVPNTFVMLTYRR